MHEHPVGLCAGLCPQAWGGETGGKSPLISIIPVPDVVSIKEEFMVYGREVLQFAGDPRTRVPQTCPLASGGDRAGS